MRLRPDPEPNRSDQRYSRLQAAATFYRGATFVLLALVVVETGVIAWQMHRARFARAIRLDGQVACFVANDRAAEAVHARLLADRKGKLPGEAALEQRWEDLNWPLNRDDKVLSVNAAVDLLKSRVTVKVSGFAIQVAKQNLVVMATEEMAKLALDTLKSQYAGADAQSATFLPKDVFTPPTQAQPKAILDDVGKAVEILKNPPMGTTKYVVASEEEGWAQIAERFGTTVSDLRRLNRSLGRVLHAGDKLTIAVSAPRLVVVVVKQEAREVPYGLPSERQLTDTLARGVTRVVSQSAPGKKAVTERVTYHNGKRVATQKVSEKIVQPAVAERLMVGTAAPAGEAAPASG